MCTCIRYIYPYRPFFFCRQFRLNNYSVCVCAEVDGLILTDNLFPKLYVFFIFLQQFLHRCVVYFILFSIF